MKRRGGGRKGRECEKQKESWCIVDGRWYSFDDPDQVVIVAKNISYNLDVKANARGYEQLATMGLKSTKRLS